MSVRRVFLRLPGCVAATSLAGSSQRLGPTCNNSLLMLRASVSDRPGLSVRWCTDNARNLHAHKHKEHAAHEGHMDGCWSCEAKLKEDKFFCSSCSRIQPPGADNYFGMLCCPQRFDINLKQLETNYWKLQMRLHPDRFHGKSSVEREYSSLQASLLNNAYNTLKHPHLRAKYMLGLMGIKFGDSGNQPVDPELLMQVMEMREAIADAEDTDALLRIKDKCDELYNKVKLEAASAFNSGDKEGALDCTTRLQYLHRIEEELRRVLPVE